MNRPSRHTLIRYFRGKSLPHEIELMVLYLAMDIDQDYVESCLKEAWVEMKVDESPQFDDANLEALKLRFHSQRASFGQLAPLANEVEKQPFHISAWAKVGTAAILLIVATTFFVYKASFKPSSNKFVNQPEEVLQGSDKALLTLADGRTISLSDAANGRLTEQAGTQVEKTAEGEIIYKPLHSADEAASVQNSVSTPKGGQYRITLPDGSKAWLNAASSLIYPVHFKDTERRVKMTGEVYFEVAKVKDPKNGKNVPFYVDTDIQEIHVLGTRFNVSAYADEPNIRTTLVEGSIRVTNTVNGHSVLLRPGQQSTMNDRIYIQTANVQQHLAWTKGEFVFKDSHLDEVLRQLSRWYDIDVDCPQHLEKRKLSGMVSRSTPLSTLIKMIESTSELKIIVSERRLVVSE